ncbi:hypothetical protein BDZ97DRAFT_1655061 [Flammula alnicola]|nr:hypothetical protein BDZ97DRAFT_1655061 [Flammula alnicola]
MGHKGVARRMNGDMQLAKRFSGTRWTFYDVGLGACGQTNVASDFVRSIASTQFGSGYPGPHCFEQIVMTYNGKTTTATIMDSCPGCPYGGLDLSRGLFDFFASEALGVLSGDWSFASNAAAATTTTTKAANVAPTTTTKAAVVPTTTSTKKAITTTAPIVAAAQVTTSTRPASAAPTTTSTHKVVATTSTSASATAALSSSLAAARSSAASLAASFSSLAPSATSSANAATNTTAVVEENLQMINALLTKLGDIIMSATLNQN